MISSKILMFLLMAATTTGVQGRGSSDQDTRAGCGYTYYGDYEPREPRTLSGFPKDIRAKLISHLKSRLGETVYSRLRYIGGEAVDFNKLYKAEPDARDYEWVVPAYRLHFVIQLGVAPPERYCAAISLDARGNVLEELALPRTVNDPGRISIISRAKALEVAAAHGVPVARASTNLEYASTCDCLEWLVGHKVDAETSSYRVLTLHLDAVDPVNSRWTESEGDY